MKNSKIINKKTAINAIVGIIFFFMNYYGMPFILRQMQIRDIRIEIQKIKESYVGIIEIKEKGRHGISFKIRIKDEIEHLSLSDSSVEYASVGDTIIKIKNINCCWIIKKDGKKIKCKYMDNRSDIPDSVYKNCETKIFN
ncbi:MAG: hypothetical protein EAZ85_04130 [Bacteroidetes bacterium]|nr:MAG: hypothetical protein EAZ85_04130 [Bacteroidota bacterium]TAG90046.1 MAG: hypothetical protein EAZ20_05290 [Bacteroidota bacterium]